MAEIMLTYVNDDRMKVSFDFELNRATARRGNFVDRTNRIQHTDSPPPYVHARILNARCARGIVHT